MNCDPHKSVIDWRNAEKYSHDLEKKPKNQQNEGMAEKMMKIMQLAIIQ